MSAALAAHAIVALTVAGLGLGVVARGPRADVHHRATERAVAHEKAEEPSAGGESASGGAGGSCVFMTKFRGRRYLTLYPSVSPSPGPAIGRASVLPCGNEPEWHFDVTSLPDVDPAIAVASTNGEYLLIAEDADPVPPEVERYLEAPTCEQADEEVLLRGPWLGILGADEMTEVDMIPPYDIEIKVVESSVADYERATIEIRVPSALGQPLTREDVRRALWKPGSLEVVARCVGGRLVAEQVRVAT